MGISRVWSGVALVPLLVTQVARADPASAPVQPIAPPSNAVPIELRGSVPGLRLEIQDPRTRRPLAYCTGACQATIVPGRYRFFANATAETRSGGHDMEIVDASKILVTPRSEAQHSTGLVLGIAGPALMVLGAAVFLSNLATTYETDGSSSSSSSRAEGVLAGMGLMIGGMVLTPIGWVMFGTSFRPRVEVTPLAR